MRKRQKAAVTWVVYKMHLAGTEGPNAVCEQAEWDEMERTRPGAQFLVRCGIATEGAAERLARGTSGDPKPKAPRAAQGVAGGAP